MRTRPSTATLLLIAGLNLACTFADGAGDASTVEVVTPEAAAEQGLAIATFAGGCFWCMEPPFDVLDGVLSTTSGYTGGPEAEPTYKQVASGQTGHAEAVRIVFDPEKISYERLLEVFWHNIDPTVADRQFCDWGKQYRTGIYPHGEVQQQLAESSRDTVRKTKTFEGQILTEIVAAGPFWPAEEYHQDFYDKSPVRYKTYRKGCGRDARLRELWGEEAGR